MRHLKERPFLMAFIIPACGIVALVVAIFDKQIEITSRSVIVSATVLVVMLVIVIIARWLLNQPDNYDALADDLKGEVEQSIATSISNVPGVGVSIRNENTGKEIVVRDYGRDKIAIHEVKGGALDDRPLIVWRNTAAGNIARKLRQ